jgi:hypothetical protein
MAEGIVLEHGFGDAHRLAERLYNLQKEAADDVMTEIKTQGTTLALLVTDVAVIKSQTSDLPELKRRIERLENGNSKRQGQDMVILLLIQGGWAVLVLVAAHFWRG